MREGELECFHGQGHSAGVHGCDGCCTKLFDYLLDSIKAEAWEEGYESVTITTVANPYRKEETT